jgi:AraC-like DNA-binding protein
MHHPIYASEFVVYSSVVRSRWQIEPHAHECFEMLYVLEGRCQVATEVGTYVAEPHSLIFFRPYQWHQETSLTDVYALVCMRFPPDFVTQYHVPLPGPAELPTVLSLPPDEAFRPILNRMVDEYQRREPYHEQMIGAYMLQFAVLLHRALRQHSGAQSLPPQAQMLQHLLDQHVTSTASLREIAHAAHMSESHLSHQVKAMLGVSPKTYVRTQRIGRARDLLASTAMSIEEIAATLGYDEPSSFFRAFKRTTGMTPGHFRASAHG